MTYSRADAQISYHTGTHDLPMVNVKVHGGHELSDPTFLARVADEEGYGADAVAWLERLTDDQWNAWWEAACESGWELAESDAREIFGPRVKVYGAGRSSGWLVVDGLPDVESWDAIMVTRWCKFERWAREQVDDIPRSTVVLALINAYAAMEIATVPC